MCVIRNMCPAMCSLFTNYFISFICSLRYRQSTFFFFFFFLVPVLKPEPVFANSLGKYTNARSLICRAMSAGAVLAAGTRCHLHVPHAAGKWGKHPRGRPQGASPGAPKVLQARRSLRTAKPGFKTSQSRQRGYQTTFHTVFEANPWLQFSFHQKKAFRSMRKGGRGH